MFARQADAWADLIDGRPSMIATAEDGLVAVAAVDAAYASAAQRTTAPIALPSRVRA
jgi:predicted dehydrogenase